MELKRWQAILGLILVVLIILAICGTLAQIGITYYEQRRANRAQAPVDELYQPVKNSVRSKKATKKPGRIRAKIVGCQDRPDGRYCVIKLANKTVQKKGK